MPAFIIIGSMIIPAIDPGVLCSTRSSTVEVVERHEMHEIDHRLRDPRPAATDAGVRRGPSTSRLLYCETMTASWWPW